MKNGKNGKNGKRKKRFGEFYLKFQCRCLEEYIKNEFKINGNIDRFIEI